MFMTLAIQGIFFQDISFVSLYSDVLISVTLDKCISCVSYMKSPNGCCHFMREMASLKTDYVEFLDEL